jgi:hypothetical protein
MQQEGRKKSRGLPGGNATIPASEHLQGHSRYLIWLMGQESSSFKPESYQPEFDLQPGTYRIVNKLASTAIQVSDHDHTQVVTWPIRNSKSQKVSRY